MRSTYDVIISGAGPAGACAGYEAAARGLKTLIIEKKRLPRYKTCGGGVPLSISESLPNLVPEAFVEATVTHLRHTWNFGDPYLAALNPNPDEPQISLWMVQRSVFDNALTERAAKAGVQVLDGLAVLSVEPDGEALLQVKTTDGDSYWTRYMIGADGANGIVARAAGLRKSAPLAIALEAEIPHVWGLGHESLRPEVAHLEFAVKNGYAWVFPKANHLSVGAGVFVPRSHEGKSQASKQALVSWITGYLEALGVPCPADQIEFHGHPLPIWNGSEPLTAFGGRILLAGDAAGMVNPLFGDGISYACKTGAQAAQAIAEGRAAQWTELVRQNFGANHDAALTISKFFHQLPAVCYKLGAKNPRGTRVAGRLISGELKFDDVIDRLKNRLMAEMKFSRAEK